jgi:hypothetical protein
MPLDWQLWADLAKDRKPRVKKLLATFSSAVGFSTGCLHAAGSAFDLASALGRLLRLLACLFCVRACVLILPCDSCWCCHSLCVPAQPTKRTTIQKPLQMLGLTEVRVSVLPSALQSSVVAYVAQAAVCSSVRGSRSLAPPLAATRCVRSALLAQCHTRAIH